MKTWILKLASNYFDLEKAIEFIKETPALSTEQKSEGRRFLCEVVNLHRMNLGRSGFWYKCPACNKLKHDGTQSGGKPKRTIWAWGLTDIMADGKFYSKVPPQ